MSDIDFGTKEFDNLGFPTPTSIPDDTACRTLQIPASGDWQAVVMGALLALADPASWQQFEGGISRDEAAARAQQMIDDAYALVETGQCGVDVQAPFWDSDTDVDAEQPAEAQSWYGVLFGESTWQEQIEDWIIAGFLAYAGAPGAAIQFLTIAPKFRLLFRTNDYGGIVKIFMDAIEFGQVDTYSATEGLTSFDVISPGSTLWIELTDQHNPDATPKNGTFWIEVVRKELTPDEISPSNIRYDPDCDCIQTLVNGAWVDTPGADPRTSPAFLLPPVTSGDDPRCDAAASIIANLRDGLTQTLLAISRDANAEGAASVLLTFFGFLTGIGELILLLIDFATLLISIGVTGVESAFTDEAYNQLECIIYCDIGADGSINATQFAQIQADITSQFGALSDVNVVMQGWLAQLGYVGLQNIAVLKHITGGDCSGCDCGWCYELDLTTADGGWTQYADWGASWSSGQGWLTGDTAPGGTYGFELQLVLPEPATLTEIDFEIGYSDSPTGFKIDLYAHDESGSHGGLLSEQDFSSPGTGTFSVTDFSVMEGHQIQNMVLVMQGFHPQGFFVHEKFKGTGDNPFGESNC